MTMRPQFASSPAIAVFTKGELAMARPTRRAEPASTAPVTSMRMNFCAPSPSRTTCSARSSSTSFNASAKPSRLSAPLPAVPVANSSTVSLVEVSLSTVVALKLRAVPAASMACNRSGATTASVNTKHSMVAMSGAIMPLPLAMPVMRTVLPPMVAVRVDALGKVSVVMIPRAASSHLPASSAPCSAGSAVVMRSCGQHLADHAGAGQEHLGGRAAEQGGGGIGGGLRRLAAAGAGEHVGVAGIHHHAARLPRRPVPRGTSRRARRGTCCG